MELVLVVLTAPTPEAGTGISSHILADILWANATPGDGLQHINVRAAQLPGSHIGGLFLVPQDADIGTDAQTAAAARALHVCQRAIQSAPALSGWTVVRHRALSVP